MKDATESNTTINRTDEMKRSGHTASSPDVDYMRGTPMRWELVDDGPAGNDVPVINSTSSHQLAPAGELAITLHQARLAKGLSLEELAERSLVHTRFIHCLEQGKDTRLADTYVRGYLRLLADHLDLAVEPLLVMHAQSRAVAAAPIEEAALKQAANAPASSNASQYLVQGRTIANEALGVLALAMGNLRRALTSFPEMLTGRRTGAHSIPRFSRQDLARNSATARTNIDASGEHSVEDSGELKAAPRALVHQGSAWNTPSLLHASTGLRWSSVAISLCGFLLLAGLYLGEDNVIETESRAALSNVDEITPPLGELAASALGEGSEQSEAQLQARQLLPLNRDERRAALAEIELAAASEPQAIVEADAVSLGSVESVQTVSLDAQPARVAAIESAVADTTVEEQGAAYANVRSIINVGQMNADGQVGFGQPAGNAQARSRLSDSYEPVGPGAEYMIAQHARQDRLVISVYEDSWVDVRDSNGVRLYRDLAQAGRRIDLSGNLPFSLHVGNAPGLALELNGEYVPIERYRSDNSARLTLAKP